eukprot:4623201-Prymnesium_polylepis.1
MRLVCVPHPPTPGDMCRPVLMGHHAFLRVQDFEKQTFQLQQSRNGSRPLLEACLYMYAGAHSSLPTDADTLYAQGNPQYAPMSWLAAILAGWRAPQKQAVPPRRALSRPPSAAPRAPVRRAPQPRSLANFASEACAAFDEAPRAAHGGAAGGQLPHLCRPSRVQEHPAKSGRRVRRPDRRLHLRQAGPRASQRGAVWR